MMSFPDNSISNLIEELSPEERQITLQFIKSLMVRRQQKTDEPLRQDWAGALRTYRNQYTALELQEKALEWRNEE